MYELRCKVAHNKDFTKASLEDVKKLVSELSPILEKAISSLDSISVSEDEKDAVFEKVLSNYDMVFSKLMSRIHKLEKLLDIMLDEYSRKEVPLRRQTIIQKINILHNYGVINDKQANIINMARKVRNRLVHNEFDMSHNEVIHTQMMLEDLIIDFEENLGRNGS